MHSSREAGTVRFGFFENHLARSGKTGVMYDHRENPQGGSAGLPVRRSIALPPFNHFRKFESREDAPDMVPHASSRSCRPSLPVRTPPAVVQKGTKFTMMR